MSPSLFVAFPGDADLDAMWAWTVRAGMGQLARLHGVTPDIAVDEHLRLPGANPAADISPMQALNVNEAIVSSASHSIAGAPR
jgi:hypothetical protein